MLRRGGHPEGITHVTGQAMRDILALECGAHLVMSYMKRPLPRRWLTIGAAGGDVMARGEGEGGAAVLFQTTELTLPDCEPSCPCLLS